MTPVPRCPDDDEDDRVHVSLLVLYTEHLDDCREFYAGLGMPLVREQHGAGPVHYAAELSGGLVLELYPGRPDRTTGRPRLGLTVPATPELPAGDHRLTDPDGRGVVVEATSARPQRRSGVAAAAVELPGHGPSGRG